MANDSHPVFSLKSIFTQDAVVAAVGKCICVRVHVNACVLVGNACVRAHVCVITSSTV